ncbi:hypothetical protein NEFER03_0316 [Nematocida sp. LUAm3]|nr:hypothetical protein NEFER03_0316 [Nematocida sp. LUAm3]KAI5173768.1 hypothetical protein NEFER02_0284 [Nematocida sp. LUAm2]KAI5176991.1 hypothetical protein NEFER01_0316 [Nematocida sp. LUAm1]
MGNEYYIVERRGEKENASPITGMRIVEAGEQLFYSEILVDRRGRIPLFTIVDKRSSEQRKGVILIERKKGESIKEFYLERERNPKSHALNINGEIYELRHRVCTKEITKAFYDQAQIFSADFPKREAKEKAKEEGRTEVFPETERKEALLEWSTVTKPFGTEITTRVMSTPDGLRYMCTVGGWHMENGIEKYIALILFTPLLTSFLLIQIITKYNSYIRTGFKEIIDCKDEKRSPSSYILQDFQIGFPSLECQLFFFDLIYYVLLEHRIVLISEKEGALLNYAQAILSSILPYKWQGLLCVPLLETPGYTKLLEATIPYIIGITGTRENMSYLHTNIPEKTIIAYIDEEKIIINAKNRENHGIFNHLRKTKDNRKQLPFYKAIIKSMSFEWPELKLQMNIYMEVISTQVSIAREKLIKQFLKEKKEKELRKLINSQEDYTEELVKYLKNHISFFKGFLGTSIYHSGISHELLQEVKDEGISSQNISSILWICLYVSGELLKKEVLFEDLHFIIEAYLRKMAVCSFSSAEALSINLFSIFSSLNAYSMIVFLSQTLFDLGIGLTQDMCSALVPSLPNEKIVSLSERTPLISPWKANGSVKKEESPMPSEESLLMAWEKLSFVGSSFSETLDKYVCTRKEALKEHDPDLLNTLISSFDAYELPY